MTAREHCRLKSGNSYRPFDSFFDPIAPTRSAGLRGLEAPLPSLHLVTAMDMTCNLRISFVGDSTGLAMMKGWFWIITLTIRGFHRMIETGKETYTLWKIDR